MKWLSRPTPREAAALQRELAARVETERRFGELRRVAGVDASVRGERVHAAIVVLSFPALEPLETVTAIRPVEFPYVPGLLGFRELPAIAEAYARLSIEPDLLLVDGHGRAHPRRMGIASHVGVELDRPSIGCGKTLLVGEHRIPGTRRGARTRLVHDGEVIGFCLRTQDSIRPLYVSIGHRIDLATAVRIVLRCTPRYRLPEPIRAADHAAGICAAAPSS
jgi:deoxyribonuclease V